MAGDPQSCQIDCSQRRQDAWQLLFKNRKKARNTTPQPATHEEGRVAGHTSCFIKAQHGAGEEKGAGSGTKPPPRLCDACEVSQSPTWPCQARQMYVGIKIVSFSKHDKERHLSWSSIPVKILNGHRPHCIKSLKLHKPSQHSVFA